MSKCGGKAPCGNGVQHDVNCQRLRCYNCGVGSAINILGIDAQAAVCDAQDGECGNKRCPRTYPSLKMAPKEFCLCFTCACNGPATLSPGDYCLVKGCNCCNPCCWCPPKCIYIQPVADGPHPVRTEFFYLRQVPTGGCDKNGNQRYCYTEDAGVTFLCRPRNARGQWTRTCHSTC